MKKSQQVPASLVIAIAASVSAAGCSCGPDYIDECVDSMGRVLPDAACHGGYYYGGYSGVHYVHIQTGGFGGGFGGGGFGGGGGG